MRTNAAAGEQPLLDWLSEQRSAMLDLLGEIVNTDSSSYDKSGVDAVGRHICRFLDRHHIAYDIVPNERFGDAIRAAIGADANATILLMGHRDTVFPKGEASRRPFRIADSRAYGPGVADTKIVWPARSSHSLNVSGRLSSADGSRNPNATSTSFRDRSPWYMPRIWGTV